MTYKNRKATFILSVSASIAIILAISVLPVQSQPVLIPDQKDGIKMDLLTDKMTYNKGENVPANIKLDNIGTKPFRTTSIMIEYDVIKDGESVWGGGQIIDYLPDRPFDLKPSSSFTFNYNWPSKINVNGTSITDAPSGEYVIRTTMRSPIELSTEKIVEVISP